MSGQEREALREIARVVGPGYQRTAEMRMIEVRAIVDAALAAERPETNAKMQMRVLREAPTRKDHAYPDEHLARDTEQEPKP
jgi:hypothetical protein